mmetsp:Transcript_124028/g.174968  ORF Transcript_124028/g.174968 Transcript_124028/m.174968 type:complete len:132 (-) Transcript_124028:75-470(-)
MDVDGRDETRCVDEDLCRAWNRVIDWYSEWSNDARKTFLSDLLQTATQHEDPLADFIGSLELDPRLAALLSAEVTIQIQHAQTEEVQVKLASCWIRKWEADCKNQLLNELESFDQDNIYTFYEQFARLRWH